MRQQPRKPLAFARVDQTSCDDQSAGSPGHNHVRTRLSTPCYPDISPTKRDGRYVQARKATTNTSGRVFPVSLVCKAAASECAPCAPSVRDERGRSERGIAMQIFGIVMLGSTRSVLSAEGFSCLLRQRSSRRWPKLNKSLQPKSLQSNTLILRQQLEIDGSAVNASRNIFVRRKPAPSQSQRVQEISKLQALGSVGS